MRQAIEGGNPHPSADEQTVLSGLFHIKAIAQAAEKIQLFPRLHLGQLLCTLAHHFIDQREGGVVPIADADGAAQIEPFQLDVDELTGIFCKAQISLEHHFIGVLGDAPIADDLIHTVCHLLSPSLSMVETPTVISSSTSSSTLTVSREVNMVTLFSTALRRMAKPSVLAISLGPRVLIT